MANAEDLIDTETALIGILALLVAERDDDDPSNRRRTEVVLADAGLSPAQIARILGKKPDAVRMTISRARKR